MSNGVPVMIADRVSTKNAIDFIQNVEIAALAAAAVGVGVGDATKIPPTSRESLPVEAAAAAV